MTPPSRSAPPSGFPHGSAPPGTLPPPPPTSFPAKPELAPPAPESVRTAAQLWWAVIALGVVRVIAGAIDTLGNRAEFERRLVEDAQQPMPEAGAQLYVSMYVVFLVMGGLVLAAAAAGAVHLFTKGRVWSRTLLTVGGTWFVLAALVALFTLGGSGGAVAFVAGAVTIVQGVLAGGALYGSYRPESNGYFSITNK
ncbi:hypothetical protein [Nocardia shimofusensis]|uniref:hypothetical protein n=1 Tax=Nocardia shimofusensis TaxID=228596 RepID=UPI000ACB7A2D|nr:hypothetical protein [Nocardia shimofusensis]